MVGEFGERRRLEAAQVLVELAKRDG